MHPVKSPLLYSLALTETFVCHAPLLDRSIYILIPHLALFLTLPKQGGFESWIRISYWGKEARLSGELPDSDYSKGTGVDNE